MQDVLVAATPPIVTALLAAAGVWLRRRSQTHVGQRAVEEARARIAVILSMLDTYRDDPSRAQEREQLSKDLDEEYRRMHADQEAAKSETSGAGLAPLAREVLLLDRRPSGAVSRALQALYYVSLAWVLLWLAAAVLFGLGIAFAQTEDSFGVRFAMSLGVTVLALAIGLAPAAVLYLVARMSAGAPNHPGPDEPRSARSA